MHVVFGPLLSTCATPVKEFSKQDLESYF